MFDNILCNYAIFLFIICICWVLLLLHNRQFFESNQSARLIILLFFAYLSDYLVLLIILKTDLFSENYIPLLLSKTGNIFINVIIISFTHRVHFQKSLSAFFWILHIKIGQLLQKWNASFLSKEICVNTSYFFREFNDYAPNIKSYNSNRNSTDNIKILSVGCSTGQEVYSLSMYCLENKIPSRIIGIDLSPSAIYKAKKGEYSFSYEYQKSIKYLGESWDKTYKKYFNKSGDTIIPIDMVKQQVQFHVEDSSQLEFTGEFDFIIARKMLYYLPKNKLHDTIYSFKKALKKGLEFPNHILIDDFTFQKIPSLKHLIHDLV